jgi:hypothetical protein
MQTYFAGINPLLAICACTGADNKKSSSLCAATRSLVLLTITAPCSIGGYSSRGITNYVPLSVMCAVTAEVSEINPASAFPESTNCAACAMLSAVTSRGFRSS